MLLLVGKLSSAQPQRHRYGSQAAPLGLPLAAGPPGGQRDWRGRRGRGGGNRAERESSLVQTKMDKDNNATDETQRILVRREVTFEFLKKKKCFFS